MGYAGYVPAKLPPAKLSGFEAALRRIESMETLEVLGKLVRNVVINPQEEKFRKIRLSNNKINTTIVQVDGALDSLYGMGWVRDEEYTDNLVVTKGKLSMAEVRSIEDAKDRLKKEQRSNMSRPNSTKSLKDEADNVRAQIEADRLERAAREPVAMGSVARELGGGTTIVTARDVGINNGGCDC